MRRILTYIFLLFSVLAWAQGTSLASGLPYECSFEESENLSAWTLNQGSAPTAKDRWVIGGAVHSEGHRALYISRDGINPNYGGRPNIVVSCLRYQFPVMGTTQKYDVSFDWKGMGDSTVSKMYVLFGLETEFYAAGNAKNLSDIVSSPNGRLSNAVKNQCQNLGSSGEKFVCGSETWQNVSFTSPVSVSAKNSNKVFMFVLIWENSNTNDSINRTSIAVDNFQINTSSIKKPENVQAYPQCFDSTLLITWESTCGEFDIEYRKTGTSSWSKAHGLVDGTPGFTRNGASECSYVLTRILEGTYDIRMRAVSRDESTVLRTSYVYLTQILVYCPENHCINYIDLYGPNVVCTYGMHEKHTGQTPYDEIGVIDYGPDSENSRHTVHKDPTELDPRADSLLHTVPPGALASVRLGNWNASGKAQSITYTMTVDTATQGILIMQYAVVLDNSGHGRDEEPYFRIEILDQAGVLIDELCGQADFAYSDAVAHQDLDSWHLTRYKGSELAWKDWTTVGLSLMDHHNQTIQVRITSADCGQTIHYGYGYFTLDCANAHIETNNCGNDASIACYAPEGFAYEWYDEKRDSVLSREREFTVDASMHTYTCRVSFVDEPGCYFEISTLSAPRFPVPEYTYEPVYKECSSKLKFNNTSHVMNKFDGFENHTTEPCTDWYWRFRRLSNGHTTESSATHPIYICPDEGDSIEITYTCYIGAENACDSTRVDTVVVPSIIPQNTEFWHTTCHETGIKFAGQWFDTDTTYVAVYPNFAGCDSVSTLHLTVWPIVEDTHLHDSICSDGFVIVDGRQYKTPMVDSLIMLKTEHGCDSAIYLTLTVNQRLEAEIDSLSYVCADDEQMFITFDLIAGVFDSLEILFSTPELHDTVIYDSSVSSIAIPYSDKILPGRYTATLRFHQFCCGIYTEERPFNIRYRASIVEQKWNDVLTLLSPSYNGGYEFLSFQWYKNDQPLMGETHSYLYQDLDMDAIYYVEVMRADSVIEKSCPIQPVHHEQQTDYPTVVTAGQHVPMYMAQPATIWYYTVSGQFYSSFTLPQGYTTLMVPGQTGVYILKSVNSEGETKAQVMLVE